MKGTTATAPPWRSSPRRSRRTASSSRRSRRSSASSRRSSSATWVTSRQAAAFWTRRESKHRAKEQLRRRSTCRWVSSATSATATRWRHEPSRMHCCGRPGRPAKHHARRARQAHARAAQAAPPPRPPASTETRARRRGSNRVEPATDGVALPRNAIRPVRAAVAITTSPIWRSGCQGVGVVGHGSGGGAWVMWLRLAGRSGRPRVRDVGHAHIRGLGTPRPLFVARPLSKVERGRPGGAGAQATNRGVGVREPGMLRPPRQPQRDC